MLCSKAYVHMFAHYGIHLSLEEVFKKYKGVKLYEIIDRVNAEQGTNPQRGVGTAVSAGGDAAVRQRTQQIAGARELLAQVTVPVCTVSNGPVSKMRHSRPDRHAAFLMTGCSAAMTFSAGSRIRLLCFTPPNGCKCR